MLVTFGDINDPKTVMLVDPANLMATFGPGVGLKSVTLEITDEAVTAGQAETVLGWLESTWPNHLDGSRFRVLGARQTLAGSIGAGSFSTEITN
jgi:hypothetical protein